MSGFCAIAGEGAGLEAALSPMLQALARRGPDRSDGVVLEGVALGHALLRTSSRDTPEQPLTLDGKVWIVADARIDARETLRATLASHGERADAQAGDAELILRGYRAFGAAVAERLLGDFAYCIWDSRLRQLVCSRDQLGVKPLFYSESPAGLRAASNIESLRAVPQENEQLDDCFIADFLMFDRSRDAARTAWAHIRRLPPAHTLVWSRDGLRISRYWSLDRGIEVRYRDSNDYVAHFRELLRAAVSDRLPDDGVGIEMSGGLDSTSVAAMAGDIVRERGGPPPVAFSVAYRRLIPDDEIKFASAAAAHIGIRMEVIEGDDVTLYGWRGRSGLPLRQEPFHAPDAWIYYTLVQRAASLGRRVMLTGWDGDALVHESPKPYLRSLFRHGQYLRAAAVATRYAASQRRLIPLTASDALLRGLGLRAAPRPVWTYPKWLAPEFEERLQLRARWEEMWKPKALHGLRPSAFELFDRLAAGWDLFDSYDTDAAGASIEFRHPLFDLRLVEFCLSLPPQPWCVRKYILRQAMAGLLPDTVRSRPKTPMQQATHKALLDARGAGDCMPSAWHPCVPRYVSVGMIDPPSRSATQVGAWVSLRPVSLDLWMRNLGEVT
jgi:asparagine synthase (glutamine-hydrolysing)